MRTGKKLYIIDGYSLIYRTYYAFLTHPLRDENGQNVSAVIGFLNTLFMLQREYRPDYLVVAMDSHGKTFRHEMYPDYKATREAAPEDLHSQVPIITDILTKMNIPFLEKQGIEADDIIASLVKQAAAEGISSIMVTGDKDLLQLVDDSSEVKALRPPKGGEKEYSLFGEKETEEAFGVKPCQIVDYLTILGDSSDNVPGIKGIGAKGAVKLLSTYGDLDSVYAHLSELTPSTREKFENSRDAVKLSKELIILRDDLIDVGRIDSGVYSMDTVDWVASVPVLEKMKAKSLAMAAAKLASDNVEIVPEVELPKDSGNLETVTIDKAEELLSGTDCFAFDLETTDLNPLHAEIVGFSFCFSDSEAFYCPIIDDSGRRVENERMKEVLGRILLDPSKKVIGQNIKYDLRVLQHNGLEIANIWRDTMLMAWLFDSSLPSYSMDHLADRFLDYKTVHFDDVVPSGELFSAVSVEKATRYAAEDSLITWRLYRFFEPKLAAKNLSGVLEDMELPLVRILAGMENAGIKFEPKILKEFATECSVSIAELEKQIYTEVGHEFNIASPKQLSVVLFEERKNITGRKTRSGYSTASDILEQLAEDDIVVEYILKYRALTKLMNTYIDTLPALLDRKDGRIHTSFLQTGTATGRLSSRDPNLQNIPVRSEDGRKIRSAFVPRDGYLLLSADYSQIELVVMAHMTGDKNLCDAFIQGDDVHKRTAAEIFEVMPELVTSDQRRIAKTINFGVMYGMSPFGLSSRLKISRADASKFINRYFERYSAVREYVDRVVAEGEHDGYVETLYGHRRPIYNLRSSNGNERNVAQREAINTVIQGTAAEIMKRAMISISGRISSLDCALLLQVHDELIFEVKAEQAEELSALVRDSMEHAAELSVPLRVNVEIGKSWGDMHL